MPPTEPEKVDEAQLVCSRCGEQGGPGQWNQADGKLVHVKPLTPLVGGKIPRVCGGQLVPQGEEWRHTFAPGLVVPCLLGDRQPFAHKVRLGYPADVHARNWSGTALCGIPRPTSRPLWKPLSPAEAAAATPCADCARRDSQGDERTLRNRGDAQ